MISSKEGEWLMSRDDLNKKIGSDEQAIEADDQQSTIEEVAKNEQVKEDVTNLDDPILAEDEALVDESIELETKLTDIETPVVADEVIELTSADVFDEKKPKNSPFVRSKYVVIGLIALIGVSLLILMVSGLFGDSKEQIARADEAVEALFMDEQHQFLNADISEADFTEAKEAIEELGANRQVAYKESYEQAEIMYEAVSDLQDIYEQDAAIIQGDEVLPVDQLLVRSSVTQHLLDEKQAEFEQKQKPRMSEVLATQISSLYQFANEVVNYTEIAQASINNLPNTVANRSQLLDVINAIQAVELQLTDYSNQPKVMELYEELQTYANRVGDIIVTGLDMGEYDPSFWDEVYWTDTLVDYFEGPAVGEERLIALTFDDGPNDEFTPQLLDILAKHEVKATFFVMGAYVDEFPDVARRIVAEGHTIANHTYNHPDLSTVSDDEVLKQFIWTQESIEDVTGVWPDLYRLPFGAGGKRVVDLMGNMTSILWNIDSMDWYYQDTTLTYDHIMANLQPNSLLLMHDTHQATPDVIDLLIPVLKEQGYHFVSPTEVGFDLRYYAE